MMLRVELRPLAASIVVVVRQLDPAQVHVRSLTFFLCFFLACGFLPVVWRRTYSYS